MWGHSFASPSTKTEDFPGGSDGKASVYNTGDLGLIPGSGRSPGEGNGNPLQYYCLENPMENPKRSLVAIAHGVTKSQTWLIDFTSPQRSLQENKRYQGNISCKDGLNKGQKWYGPERSRILRSVGKNPQKNCTKKIFTTQIIMIVWSLT